MNKLNLNGSRLQKINDVILIILYFIVRIVCGIGMTIALARDVWRERDGVSGMVITIYGACSLATNILNIYWFTKLMRQALAGVDLRGIKVLRRKQKALVDVHEVDMSSASHLPGSVTTNPPRQQLHHRHKKGA